MLSEKSIGLNSNLKLFTLAFFTFPSVCAWDISFFFSMLWYPIIPISPAISAAIHKPIEKCNEFLQILAIAISHAIIYAPSLISLFLLILNFESFLFSWSYNLLSSWFLIDVLFVASSGNWFWDWPLKLRHEVLLIAIIPINKNLNIF